MGAAAALFAAGTAINVGSQIIGAFSDKKMSKYARQQYDLQYQQLELQKEILSDQYRQQRQKLQGDIYAAAGASGVKVSGSVAESLSNSLTELGIEESRQKFGMSWEQNNLAYEKRMNKVNSKQQFIARLIGAGTTALQSGATYNQYWGSATNTGDTSGQSSGWNPAKSAPAKKPSYRR